MFPIDPDSRTSRRERSRRSTKPSRAANRRLDPQTLRESSSYALLVNGLSDENSRIKLQNVVADSSRTSRQLEMALYKDEYGDVDRHFFKAQLPRRLPAGMTDDDHQLKWTFRSGIQYSYHLQR